jgi:hypothetical protein
LATFTPKTSQFGLWLANTQANGDSQPKKTSRKSALGAGRGLKKRRAFQCALVARAIAIVGAVSQNFNKISVAGSVCLEWGGGDLGPNNAEINSPTNYN